MFQSGLPHSAWYEGREGEYIQQLSTFEVTYTYTRRCQGFEQILKSQLTTQGNKILLEEAYEHIFPDFQAQSIRVSKGVRNWRKNPILNVTWKNSAWILKQNIFKCVGFFILNKSESIIRQRIILLDEKVTQPPVNNVHPTAYVVSNCRGLMRVFNLPCYSASGGLLIL